MRTRTPTTRPPAAPAGADPVSVRRGVVPVLVATALVVLVQLYVSIPLRGPISADLGAHGVTEALSSGFALCYAVGFLVYGPLSDHVGRRPVLVVGLAALSGATIVVAMAGSVGVLGPLRAVQGAAAASFAPTALAYLGEALPPARRAGAIGAMSVAFLAAGIIGQVAAGAVAAAWGWRPVFLAGGILLALLTVAVAATVRPARRIHDTGPLMVRYAALGRFAIRPTSLLLATGHLMLLGGFVGLYTLLGPHLGRLGLSSGDTTLVRAAALPAMFASLGAGRIIRRVGPDRTAAIAFTTAAAGLAAVALFSSSVAALTAASIVFVAGIALAVPTLITLWGDASAPQRGIGMAVNGFVLFLGASLGPYAPALSGDFTRAIATLAVGYLLAGALVHAAAHRLHPSSSNHPR